MKTIFKIVALFAFAVAAVSCSHDLSESVSEGGRDAADGGKVTLLLNVETLQTRAGGTDTKQDLQRPFEKPQYLRVVIVNTDFLANVKNEADPRVNGDRTNTPWNVEVNYRISEDMALGGDVMDAAGKQLKFPNIEADRKKRIYIFINCEDIEFTLKDGVTKCSLNDGGAIETLFGAGESHTEEFNATAEHPYQTGRLPIDDCTYSFEDTGKKGSKQYAGLPYVGVYEVDVPPASYVLDNYGTNPDAVLTEPQFPVGPLYLVRAANRIRFEYINDTAHADGDEPGAKEIDPIDIEVLGWTLSETADRAYLMPHLTENWKTGLNKDGKTAELSVPENLVEDGKIIVSAKDYYGGAWMLWLKQEAERTQNTDTYNGETDPGYEWLTGYSVPENTQHKDTTYVYEKAITVNKNTTVQVPKDGENAVYFAESKYQPNGDQQKYSLSVTVRQTNIEGNETPVVKTYTCEELPNSSSLFRNTDLLVRVRFRKLRTDGLEMSVDVVPYGVCELDPVFGLEDNY